MNSGGAAALLNGLRSLGPRKLAALAAVALVSLGLLGALAFRGTAPTMSLLYGDLDLREAGGVADSLARARIPYEVEAGGTRILVPAAQVASARMLLAKEGLPSGGSVGYEIFDRTDSLTATAFQQNLNQARALEGELSRTIRTLQGVRAARVHLVLPRREPFARDRQEAQASVVLTMAGAARLDREGTQAVLNLIAAAVPGLKPQNIAMADSRGNLLARAGQPSGPMGQAQTADELRRAAEQRISRAVEEMLERTLGAGRVRAEASVDLNFDQVRETEERFDPEGQVVRSQQSNSGNNRNTEAAPNVSVGNNLPNADPAASAAGSQEQKTEETTNYEISKTVRTVVRDQPQLRRLTLAVMVDGTTAPGPDGKPTWSPRPAEELASITGLVRGAVGYDEKRGDKVEVVSMRFVGPEDVADAAAPGLMAQFARADVLHLAEVGLACLALVLCLLLVFRPMVLRLALAGPGGALTAVAGPAGAVLGGSEGVLAGPAGGGAAMAGLPGPHGAAHGGAHGTGPNGVDMSAYPVLSAITVDARLPSVNQVVQMVEGNPEGSLAMLRSWMAEAEP